MDSSRWRGGWRAAAFAAWAWSAPAAQRAPDQAAATPPALAEAGRLRDLLAGAARLAGRAAPDDTVSRAGRRACRELDSLLDDFAFYLAFFETRYGAPAGHSPLWGEVAAETRGLYAATRGRPAGALPCGGVLPRRLPLWESLLGKPRRYPPLPADTLIRLGGAAAGWRVQRLWGNALEEAAISQWRGHYDSAAGWFQRTGLDGDAYYAHLACLLVKAGRAAAADSLWRAVVAVYPATAGETLATRALRARGAYRAPTLAMVLAYAPPRPCPAPPGPFRRAAPRDCNPWRQPALLALAVHGFAGADSALAREKSRAVDAREVRVIDLALRYLRRRDMRPADLYQEAQADE